MENNKEIHYRHEWKHEINWSDLISIRQPSRIRTLWTANI